jgi:hypothetical protein
MKWASIPGLDHYEVSELGSVVRRSHTVKDSRYIERCLPEKTLKPMKNHDGYMRVKMKGRLVFVHVLVLEAFVGPRPPGMQCCHNNGIPDDNRLINLRWDTPKNNVHDRRFHGTYQYGEKNPNYKHGQSFYCLKNRQQKTPPVNM